MPKECPLYTPEGIMLGAMVEIETVMSPTYTGPLDDMAKKIRKSLIKSRDLTSDISVQGVVSKKSIKKSFGICGYGDDNQRVSCGGYMCPRGYTEEEIEQEYARKRNLQSSVIQLPDGNIVGIPGLNYSAITSQLKKAGIASPSDVAKSIQKIVEILKEVGPAEIYITDLTGSLFGPDKTGLDLSELIRRIKEGESILDEDSRKKKKKKRRFYSP